MFTALLVDYRNCLIAGSDPRTQAADVPRPSLRLRHTVVVLSRLAIFFPLRSPVEMPSKRDDSHGTGARKFESSGCTLSMAARRPLIVNDHHWLPTQLGGV